MAILNVNPTRVELKNLSERLKIASRGHALLKEKQDSLIRKFMGMIEDAQTQRRVVDEVMGKMFHSYQQASLTADDEVLQILLNAKQDRLEVDRRLHHVMGVKVPHLELKKETSSENEPADTIESFFLAPEALDEVQRLQPNIVEELIKLANIEKQCFLLGEEIIATRRRVNSLEFRTIPDLEETIAFIKMKIDDQERSQVAKLIQLK